MNPTSPPTTPEAQDTKLLTWLLLLPAVVLGWPGPSAFAGDYATTEITAVAVAALLLVPLLIWLLWKRPLPVRGCLALFLALLLPLNFVTGSDTLLADRATLTCLVGILAATGAAALTRAGTERLVHGLAAVSILFTAPALIEGSPGWGGVLGNSGELSGAALPGAFCGMILWGRSEGPWCWVGMTAVGLFLLHALLAPVLASLLLLSVVSIGIAFLGQGIGVHARTKLASVFVLTLVGAGWVASSSEVSNQAAEVHGSEQVTGEAPPGTIFGGFEVRQRIWTATVGMFSEHPWSGVGTGQFAVAFPQYRDPQELELSNWNRLIEQNTEVENPHNDWLLPWAEGGVLSGVAWWFFLISVLSAGLRALKRGDTLQCAVAAGAVGSVAGAGLNAVLLYNPAASLSSFLLFGALLGAARRREARTKRRWSFAQLLTPGLALLLLLHVPRAWNMWRHGTAIARIGEVTSLTDQGLAIEDALAACQDSVVALSLQARLREGRDGDLAGALESWTSVLKLRPLRFEAWMQSGVVLARLGRMEEAREAFDRALELDRAHPALARNRIRCFAESNHLDQALAEVTRLEELGHYDTLWLLGLATDLLLSGYVAEALPLLERVDVRFKDLTGEQAWAYGGEYRRTGNPKIADALRSLAYFTWAREQAEAQEWADARRSYFQALRIMRDYVPPAGPLRVRTEHAAALWHSGRKAEAREEFDDSEVARLNWALAPDWVTEALFELNTSSKAE